MSSTLRSFSTFIVIATVLVGCSQGEPLPHGYAVFFASGSEASLVKPATKGGGIIAGPHVAEFGHSGSYIFGRIEPKKGIPPHPDHAPGFFIVETDTDKVTTGLDRAKWLTELQALGIDSPQLHPPEHKWPKKY